MCMILSSGRDVSVLIVKNSSALDHVITSKIYAILIRENILRLKSVWEVEMIQCIFLGCVKT